MTFSKAKMLARLEKEGRLNQVTDNIAKIMGQLDGKEAVKNNFKALVYDENEYMIKLEGEWYSVNELDCE